MNTNHNKITLEDVLLQSSAEEINEFLSAHHPADIADLVSNVANRAMQKQLLGILDHETVAEVLNHLDDEELAAELLQELPMAQAALVLEEMSVDDAADILNELADEDQAKLLGLLQKEDACDVQELMDYDEDTAGGLMTTEYVSLVDYITAEKAIEVLRELAPDAETVYYVYVINSKNQLVGVLSLRELIVANPDALISEIMRTKLISVNVHEDQEEVAKLVTKYNFLVMPVVDDDQQLVGIITVDDIIDVIHEEATEDLYRMAGTTEAEEDDVSFRLLSAFRSRIPWLLVTIMGGFLSGQILSIFSVKLGQVAALSFFIPMLIGMGGNVGTQSSTVTVRGIATGNIAGKNVLKTIIREAAIGASLGLTIGSIVAFVAYLWQGEMMLGAVVGIAMFCNMLTAATMGTLVPITLKGMGIDPAVASAPFITTTIDCVGLVIYVAVASLLLGLY